MEHVLAGSAILDAGATVNESTTGLTEQAFQVFYQRTARGLWGYLRRVSGDAALADDLTQEALLRLLRHQPQLQDEDQLRAYLYRVASNLMVDHWRARRVRERFHPADAPPVRLDDGLAVRIDMKRSLGALRLREHALLWLAYVEGSDHREIAAALGLSAKSVRVLLFRARRRLASLLDRYGVPAGER